MRPSPAQRPCCGLSRCDVSIMDNWNESDFNPNEEGFYAVLACWDVHEGFFTSTVFFDGKKLSYEYPVAYWHGPFTTEREAEDFSDKNDPHM